MATKTNTHKHVIFVIINILHEKPNCFYMRTKYTTITYWLKLNIE